MKKQLGFFIMAVAWVIASLMWFFGEKNIPIGVICVCVAAVNLTVGVIETVRETKKTQGGERQ